VTTPTLGLSVLAGLLAFLSPCIIPLVPSYLSFIGGTTAADLDDARARRRLVVRTLFFVAGFTVVFVTLGTLLAGSGVLFGGGMVWVNVVAGAIIVFLGLNLIFDFWKALNVERRFEMRKPRGIAGSFLMGMAFGAGWTPCIGPMLATILVLAGTSGSVATGVFYLTAFSLGLGIPFLLVSLFFSALKPLLVRLRAHARQVQIVSGILLVGIGALVALGRLQTLSSVLLRTGYAMEQWSASSQAGRPLVAAALVILGLLPPGVAWIRQARGVKTARPLSVAKLVFASALVTLSILHATGVIDVAAAVGGWFRYAGL